MTPKEKAEELFDKMYGQTLVKSTILEIKEDKQLSKRCALIAANEMLNDIPFINNTDQESSKRVFWIYTIEEINKL